MRYVLLRDASEFRSGAQTVGVPHARGIGGLRDLLGRGHALVVRRVGVALLGRAVGGTVAAGG